MKPAYSDFAAIYDELLGRTAFGHWRENFEQLVKRFEMDFSVAADVACGTGLAASYLAESCDRVYAVDRSERMLEIARERCREYPIVFLLQSFLELDLPEPVDLMTCNFDSINYIPGERELGYVVERFSRFVKPGGFLVFDVNTARELDTWIEGSNLVHSTIGGISVWECSWDPDSLVGTVLMTNFIKVDDGLFLGGRELHREKVYGLELIRSHLENAGFPDVSGFDARDLTGVDEDTRRIQFVARKRS